jgi:hypothetical protein
MPPPIVVISYSREDEEWKECLERHLRVLVQQQHIRIHPWYDGQFGKDGSWFFN